MGMQRAMDGRCVVIVVAHPIAYPITAAGDLIHVDSHCGSMTAHITMSLHQCTTRQQHHTPRSQLSAQWRQHISELAPLLKQHDCEPEGPERLALLNTIKATVEAADRLTMLMGLFTPTFLSLLTAGVGCEAVLASRGDEVEWWKRMVVRGGVQTLEN